MHLLDNNFLIVIDAGCKHEDSGVGSQEMPVNGYQTHGVTQITAVFIPQILHY